MVHFEANSVTTERATGQDEATAAGDREARRPLAADVVDSLHTHSHDIDDDIAEVYNESVGVFDTQVSAWEAIDTKYAGKCIIKRDVQYSQADYNAMVLGVR